MIKPSAYYLGSPGRMYDMGAVKPGVQPGRERYSSLNRSQNGTGTEWLFGTKRTYSLELPYCTPTDLAWLDLCWQGGVNPLWFIDPLTPNRFSEAVAATGSTFLGDRAFTSVGGNIAPVPIIVPPFPGAPPMGVTAVGATALTSAPIPAIPGETLTFVSWSVANTANATPTVQFTDAHGAALGSPVTATPIPSGNTVVKSVVTAVVPVNAAFATYSITTPTASGISSTAWRAGSDGATEWSGGGGSYRVRMSSWSGTSDRYPLETVTLGIDQL